MIRMIPWRRSRTVRIRRDRLPNLNIQNHKDRALHYRRLAGRNPAFRQAYLHLADCHDEIVALYEAIDGAIQ